MYQKDQHVFRWEVLPWRHNPYPSAARVLQSFIESMEGLLPKYPGDKGRGRRVILRVLRSLAEQLHRLHTEDPASCLERSTWIMTLFQAMVTEMGRLEAKRSETPACTGDEQGWKEENVDRDDRGRFAPQSGGSGGGKSLDLVAQANTGSRNAGGGEKRELAAQVKKQEAPAQPQKRKPYTGPTHKIVTEWTPEAADIMSGQLEALKNDDNYAKYVSLVESGDINAINWKIREIEGLGNSLAPSDAEGTARLHAELLLLIYGEKFYTEFTELKKQQADVYAALASAKEAGDKAKERKLEKELGLVNKSVGEKTSAASVFGDTFVKSQDALARNWQGRMGKALESREIRGYIREIDSRQPGTERDELLAEMLMALAREVGMPVNSVKFWTNMGPAGETVGRDISLNADLMTGGKTVSYELLMRTFFHEAGHAWSNTTGNLRDGARETTLLSRQETNSEAAEGIYNIHPRELQAKLFELSGADVGAQINKLRR